MSLLIDATMNAGCSQKCRNAITGVVLADCEASEEEIVRMLKLKRAELCQCGKLALRGMVP
jgi:hypothetical protein